MARNIRWTAKQKSNLSKAVSAYNRKLTLTAKKNPALAEFLPARASVKSLRDSISTNAELKREINALKKIYEPKILEPITTKKGIKTTKYEIENIKRLTRQANKIRDKERKELPDDPEYKGILGSIKNNMLRARNFNPDVLSKEGWKSFTDKVFRQSRDSYLGDKYERYKENYLKAMINGWGGLAQKSGLYDLVKSLPAEVVAKAYYESGFLDIQFPYSDFAIRDSVQRAIMEWEDYLGDKNIKYTNDIVEVQGGYVNKSTGEFFPFDPVEERELEQQKEQGYVGKNRRKQK